MFKRMIRIELHRALHSWGMKFSLAVGFLLAVEHFIFRVLPQLDYFFFGYAPDVGVSCIRSVQANWLGTICAESNIYGVIVTLLITIPYAGSFYTDRTKGIIKNISVRGDKKAYLVAKSIAVSVSAGIAAVFPLIVSLMLTSMVMPATNYVWNSAPACVSLFTKINLAAPVLYDILYMLIIFVFSGLVAGVSLSLSLYANNIFVVLSFPFLLYQILNRLVQYLGNSVGSSFIINLAPYPIYSVNGGTMPIIPLIVLFLFVFAAGHLIFILKGVKSDVL